MEEVTIINLLGKELIRLSGQDKNPLFVRSPGRINLIGEHTDYNDGFVLPSAIDRAIYFAIQPTNGFEARIRSLNFNDDFRFQVNHPVKSGKGWANYLIGVVNKLKEAGYSVRGFDCILEGNIPIGAGLSSSAAIGAGLGYALNEVFNLGIERCELARLVQKSENEFVGLRCGIMDQFANLLSKEDSVFKLDCRSLQYEYHRITPDGLCFVLCDTQVKHELASSKYNVRRRECEDAVHVIAAHHPGIKSLRDVTSDILMEQKKELGDALYRRSEYVLAENDRVVESCRLIDTMDFEKFGDLLYESHRGLRDEYEVSCDELDILVEAASKVNGVLGARMMGAGFGGCTLNLVKVAALREFEKKIEAEYLTKVGKKPLFYECNLVGGTSLINNQHD